MKIKKIISMVVALNIAATACAVGVSADLQKGAGQRFDARTLSAQSEMAEGMQMPDGERPEMPEGMQMPNGERPEMPEGMQIPDGERPEMPEGMQMPNGERPEMPEDMNGGRGQNQGKKTKSDKFKDVDENYSWAAEQIDYLFNNGIVNGISDDMYAPSEAIKRGDFVLMLHRKYNFKTDISENFSDVTDDSYYSEAIKCAKGNNIFRETEEFSPETAITRQDALYMIYNALKSNGQISEDMVSTDVSQYSDADEIADYAVEAVATLSEMGIIQGSDGAFNPEATMTRAEMAVVFYNIANVIDLSIPEMPENINGDMQKPDRRPGKGDKKDETSDTDEDSDDADTDTDEETEDTVAEEDTDSEETEDTSDDTEEDENSEE